MPRPTVQCQLDLACDAVVEAASSLLPAGEATWVITPGRSPAGSTHAEVHACYPDGRYLLALRTTFQDRMPGPEDAADIVLLDGANDYAEVKVEERKPKS